MLQFRTMDAETHKAIMGWRNSQDVTFILLKANGASCYAIARSDKDNLVAEFDEAAGDRLIWPWVGQFSTAIFQLSRADLRISYFKKGGQPVSGKTLPGDAKL